MPGRKFWNADAEETEPALWPIPDSLACPLSMTRGGEPLGVRKGIVFGEMGSSSVLPTAAAKGTAGHAGIPLLNAM